MENNLADEIGKCLGIVDRLEKLAKQDAEDMEKCTNGQVLTGYRIAMDAQLQRLQQIKQLLMNILSQPSG